MSRYTGKQSSQSILTIKEKKINAEKISMVTCYDAVFARLIDQCDIDIVLVGDSLGNVMMGYEDTTRVTIENMIYHSSCVQRVLKRPLLCVDMPFMSYHLSTKQCVKNAARLVQEGGAQCVKIEGGAGITPQVQALVGAGIPVMGHIGLTPQKINTLGGYRVQGRDVESQEKLIADAKALEKAGAFAIVLELVPSSLAGQITKELEIPTIGIGAGKLCDGQVLVLHDLLGFEQNFSPKFVKKYANAGAIIKESLNDFSREVKNCEFPSDDHSFF